MRYSNPQAEIEFHNLSRYLSRISYIYIYEWMILWTSISVCGPNKKNCSIYPRPVGLSCCKTRRARRSSLVGVAWKPHACMPHGQNLVRSTNFTSFGDSTLYLYEYIEHMKHTCAAWWKWWCAWVKSKWYNFWSVCCNLVTCVCVCVTFANMKPVNSNQIDGILISPAFLWANTS